MLNTKYQPIPKRNISDAQEVHYAKEFKRADVIGGFRDKHGADTKSEKQK